MAVTTTKVNTDGTTLERKVFDSILQGIREQHLLLPLITDVSSQFNPGTKSFEVFSWGLAGNVADTPEDGSDIANGNMPIYSTVIPCDQDKVVGFLEYDKGTYLSAVDYAAGFYSTAGFKHARAMEAYVSGLMRAVANTSITCTGDTSGTNKDLSEADIESLALAMDNANLPKEGRRLIVTPRQKHGLIRAFGLKAVDASGDSRALRDAFVSRLYGFDVYEANTNILPAGSANQAMAFVSDACWWGLGLNVTIEQERQVQKARTFHSVRVRYGAKVNDLENADGGSQTRIWLIGEGA
jgi:hypothetical protein